MIDVLRQAWSDGLVRGDAAGIYRYPEPGFNVTPKPARPGGPPIWIGAGADVAVERAGRVADGYISSSASPKTMASRAALVRQGAEAAGRDPSTIDIAVHRPTFAWRDGDAWDVIGEYAHYMSWKYADMDEAFGSLERRFPPTMTQDIEADVRRRAIIGTPEQVAEQITAYREALGPTAHFIARSYFPGLDPGIQRETLRIFGEEVRGLLA